MPVVTGIATEDARKYWPQLIGALFIPATPTNVGATQWDPRIKTFKIGEGGWINPGGGRVPRTPVANLRRLSAPLIQELDAVVDTTRLLIDQRYPSDSRATFEKTLTGADFTFEGTSTIRVRCLLDFGEFNNDGFGNSPELYEIGLFSDHPTISAQKMMVAYATFPAQVKDNSKQLENVVRIVF